MSDTPETDALRQQFEHHLPNWLADQFVALSRRLERQRDELKRELSDLFKWVERRSQDGFIDSQTTEQNITRCYDALYDRVDDAIRERDEARRELQAERDLPTNLLDVNAICQQRDEARRERDALMEAMKEIASGAWCWKTCVDQIAPRALASVKGGEA